MMCNMSFLTNLMVTIPFPILFLQSEIYALNPTYILNVREMVNTYDVNDLVEVTPNQLLFSNKINQRHI